MEIVDEDKKEEKATYKILKNRFLKTKAVKMTVDKVLAPHIKPPLPSKNGFCIFCTGVPGSGKTSWLVNAFRRPRRKRDNHAYYGVFDKVIFVSPSIATIRDDHTQKNPFTTLPDEQLFSSLLRNLEEIDAQIDDTANEDEEPGFCCLILDDVMAELHNDQVQTYLTGLVSNRRHRRTSLIITTQVFNGIPSKVRKLGTTLCLFPTASARELDSVYEDFGAGMNREKWRRVCNVAFEKTKEYPYPFLFCDRRRSYKCFDKIILK